MKKDKTVAHDNSPMRDEYDFSGGERGKFYEQYQRLKKRRVFLDPDVARLYPDSKAVNAALRKLAAKAAG